MQSTVTRWDSGKIANSAVIAMVITDAISLIGTFVVLLVLKILKLKLI